MFPIIIALLVRLHLCSTLYSDARAGALKELYKSKELDKDRPEKVEADFEEVAASCGHFSFSLQDFANEMQNFLTILEALKEVTENQNRSWSWLRFWHKHKEQSTQPPVEDPEQERLIDEDERLDVPKDIPELVLETRNARNWRDFEFDNASTREFYQKVLHVTRVLERDDGMLCFSIFTNW